MKNPLEIDEGLIANLKSISISSRNLEELLAEGCELLCKHFKSKLVTIYLSVKEPSLELHYLAGEGSKYNGKITPGNRYVPNQGLVGQLFDNQLRHKKAYVYTDSISDLSLDNMPLIVKKYPPKRNMLAIPLAGENRVLGAIEFVDSDIDHENPHNYVLSTYIAAQIFSRAVSSMLRGEIIRVIEASSLMGIEVLNRNLSEDEYLKKIANEMIGNDLINYYVSIIRVYSKYNDKVNKEFYSSNSNIDWSNFNKVKHPDMMSASSNYYMSGEKKIVESINKKNISEFENQKWILDNRLKAYICVPINFSDRCIGTLSLFLRYPYRFYSADFLFIDLLSHSIGKTIGLEERMGQVRKEVAENTRATVRELSDLVSIKEFSHAYKNDIRTIKTTLDEVIPTLTKGRTAELQRLSHFLDERKHYLESFITSSRGEHGIKTAFSLNDLLDEIVSHFRTEIELEGIKVEKSYGDIPFVLMDKNRLLEAISNIFLNAIKSYQEASARSGKIISISTYIDTTFDDYCIQITDNGVGISNSLLPDKIFEEGVSGFSNSDGTGQGLFYSKSILDSFTGEIDVISSIGNGSTFTIRFPRDLFEDT